MKSSLGNSLAIALALLWLACLSICLCLAIDSNCEYYINCTSLRLIPYKGCSHNLLSWRTSGIGEYWSKCQFNLRISARFDTKTFAGIKKLNLSYFILWSSTKWGRYLLTSRGWNLQVVAELWILSDYNNQDTRDGYPTIGWNLQLYVARCEARSIWVSRLAT